MDTGTPDSGNGSIAEATSAFEKILAGPAATQDDEGEAPESPTDEVEAHEATSEDDETPEADEAEGEDDEEATANDEDGDEEDQPPQERMITVKIDGNTMQLPESEVAKGYQRQADYSRHMAVLKQEHHQVRAERAQYAQLLPALVESLQQLQPQEPNWDELYQTDPLEYVRQRELHRERNEQLQAAQLEHQRVAQLMEMEAQQELAQRVAEGRQQLNSYNPAWSNKETWEKDRQSLRQYLAKVGYSEEEIGKAYDPRAVTVAHKAMLYDRLMSKKPVPVKQASPQPASGGTAKAMPARKHTDHSKAKMRLAKTGSLADAAAVFKGLL